MIEVGDLVRPTEYACRELQGFQKDDMGIVTRVTARELGRRAIVYVMWNYGSRRWQKAPMARVWLEKVDEGC